MKKLLSTILLATIVVAGFSQDNAKKKEKRTELYGYIIDTFTKAAVPQDSLKVFVLDTDSVLVDTAHVYGYRTYMGFDKTYWEAKVPARALAEIAISNCLPCACTASSVATTTRTAAHCRRWW